MNRALYPIVLPFLMALPLPAAAELRAVLIGVGDYLTLDADLKGPPNDVRLMAEVLAERGVPFAEMTVLTTDASDLPAGVVTGVPTKAAIMDALADVAGRALPGDTVVFYFSGHGGQAPDQNGDEGGGFDEIFLPADAAGWNGATGQVENALLDDELQAWAQPMLARGVRLVGLIDACHSDTGFRGVGDAVARGLGLQDLGIPDLPQSAGNTGSDLAGDFVFLYSSQSDQRSFEYPLGDSGLWQGEFTLRLAETLRRAPDAPWSQVLAATSAAMAQGTAAQLPDGEGPMLDQAIFGHAAAERFAIKDGAIEAGLLQGLNRGDEVALYAEASGGEPLATVRLTNVTPRSAQYSGTAQVAVWAEVVAPAAPDPLRLGAAVRANPEDGFDYAPWIAALSAGDNRADLVPILTEGTVALAGPDGILDPVGQGASPRIRLMEGETEATALARTVDQAAHAVRLRKLLGAVAGRSLTGKAALTLNWQRKPAEPGCGSVGAAVDFDPAEAVQPCDQLWLQFQNTAGKDLDVSLLYFNADFSISPLWPRQGLSNRLAPGESARAGLRIDPDSPPALDELLILAVPVEPSAARVDLTRLASAEQTRGQGDWFAARLAGEDLTTRGFSAKPAALMMFRQSIRVAPAQ